MRTVGHKDTAAEVRLRRHLWHSGLRYRKHLKIAGACPNIAFIGPHVAVFVDGCFWHGCPQHYTAPIGNAGFWREKLRRNKERDRRDSSRLQRVGWIVVRIWECDVNHHLDAASDRVSRAVEDGV